MYIYLICFSKSGVYGDTWRNTWKAFRFHLFLEKKNKKNIFVEKPRIYEYTENHPLSVYVHWKFQVSTLRLCKLNTGPWLAAK